MSPTEPAPLVVPPQRVVEVDKHARSQAQHKGNGTESVSHNFATNQPHIANFCLCVYILFTTLF